tara:strand:+ start:220 stop:1023 length:804 start_codon:yes stop_codon:yes gene_type:complete
MNPEYPVYILSKGRADNCITANNLIQANCTNFKIVVEPQDYDKYNFYYDKAYLLKLDKNNQGVAYVRQYIKDYDKSEYHWALDDDLKFKKRIYILAMGAYKNIPYNPLEMFREVEAYVKKYKNIGLAGFRNSVWAFKQKNDISFNKQVASCVLVKKNTNAQYNKNIIEDTDYCMQLLTLNYCTVIFNRLLYDAPSQGKEKGGNTNELYHHKITELQQALVNKWKCFEIEILKNKKIASRIKPSRIWMTFKQRPILRPYSELYGECFL